MTSNNEIENYLFDKEISRPISVRLLESQIRYVKRLGGGEMSAGVRALIASAQESEPDMGV